MITNVSKLRISVMSAITIVGGGAWWLSAFYTEMQAVKSDVQEVKADVKTLLSRRGAEADVTAKSSACPKQFTLAPWPKEKSDVD